MSFPRRLSPKMREALRGDPVLTLHGPKLKLQLEDGDLILEGELDSVAEKKVVLRHAAALPGVAGIVDRLRVRPATRMSDAQIRDHVRDALLADSGLGNCAITTSTAGRREIVRAPSPETRGDIEVRAEDGVVTLDGDVPSLAHRRLAGVLAWWVPGTRDVVNGLGVVPFQEDNDDEITDAVRVVLDRDPFVDQGQIDVFTTDSVVTLFGTARSEEERLMAERDAWCVHGVDRVENHLEVRWPGSAPHPHGPAT